MAWEAIAVRYATLRSTKNHMFLRWESYDEPDSPQTLDYYFWVLRDADRAIVVDTGFNPAVGARRGRSLLVRPERALTALGLSTHDIETVVITHLHYDHIGNLDQFRAATVMAPSRDIDFWTSPLALRPQFAEHIETPEVNALVELETQGRLVRYDGEHELLPGVSALPLPGHSPGQHGLLVQTNERPVLLTSDAVHFYEELERDRPFAIQVDLAATYTSYDRVRELAATHDAVLVPGHDPSVIDRFPRYPDASLSGLAVRLV